MPTFTRKKRSVRKSSSSMVPASRVAKLEQRLARAQSSTKQQKTKTESLVFSLGGPALVAYAEKRGWKLPDLDGIDPMLTIGAGLLFFGDSIATSAAMKKQIAAAAEGCLASGMQRAIARDSIRIHASSLGAPPGPPPAVAVKGLTEGEDDDLND